jgi:protein-tyrosine phosphatase
LPTATIRVVRIENSASRWIALDGAVNARAVVPGALLRSDNLQALSERDVRALLEEQGLEVVLDLRTDVEVALEGPGPISTEPAVLIQHCSLYPDSGANAGSDPGTVITWAPPDRYESPQEPPVVRTYISYMARRPDSIVASIRAIAAAERAVLVHCAAGKDRTGVVVALLVSEHGDAGDSE